MQIARNGDLPESSDFELISRLLPIDGARLLELGCGTALTTRRLAESLPVGHIVAMEVDRVQHDRNLLIDDLSRVTFAYGGAQAIDQPDASIDAVIMLKSLHHVPVDDMDAALGEIARVLRPGGMAYISEPVYAGQFNEIMCLFHDERQVREAAFAAVQRAVANGPLTLREEIHFRSLSRFDGFAEFERRILGATHSEFDIDTALYERIRAAFLPHLDGSSIAEFRNPMRVDLLQKPE